MRRVPRHLAEILARTLAVALARRAVAWLACCLILLSVGGAASSLFGWPVPVRLGVILGALSMLPAFLLWPLAASALEARLRAVDQETVIEAWLEAPSGPARPLLAELARRRCEALAFQPPPRERLLRGLGTLLAVALAVSGSIQAAFLVVTHRSLDLLTVRDESRSTARRIEPEGFSELAREDAASRLERWESRRAGEGGAGAREAEPGTASGEERTGLPSPRRLREPVDDRPLSAPPADAPRDRPAAADRRSEAGSGPELPDQGDLVPADPSPAAESRDGDQGVRPDALGRRGQGYDPTGDTRVPSPLLDYRSRFASVYAQRTGKNIGAADQMGMGDLRDYQRRFFRSFALQAEIAPAEDPYAALLKRRWSERKESAR